jgi:DNA polymerase III sliding clamp (beta) subunit (PCNA family)
VFLKHAEFLTKNAPDERPVLKGVYHHPNKSLIVTDSHRLYVAKDAHNLEEGSVIVPKTGEKIEGNFPDVHRLIPETDFKGVIHIEDVKETLDAVKSLLTAGCVVSSREKKPKKEHINIQLCCDDQRNVTLKVKNAVMKSEYLLNESQELEPCTTMTFRAEYFAQALALFKEAGYTKIDFQFFGSLRPLVLTSYQDSLKALILPVRTVQ